MMIPIPETVQVAVRIRPLSSTESRLGCQSVTERIAPGEPRICVRNSTELFTFNHVFDPASSQREVYETSIKSIVDKLLEGFNVTILAYGQTGSGKTYTMGTSFEGTFDEEVGIIPRTMVDLFDQIALCGEFQCDVSCSFVELYQENVYDLLSYRHRFNKIIAMREDARGVIIPGLTEAPVNSAEETLRWLKRGASERVVASTSMNEESNRSHTIFTMTVRKIRDNQIVTVSRLHLVDLAGSERSRKTGAVGDRLKESILINKGLLALGNVIAALGSAKTPKGYISYRDSKLTRLLQSSLGGNSITIMFACVSPSDYNLEETLSTLRYAHRALRIHNKPTINGCETSSREEIERLRIENQELRSSLELLHRKPVIVYKTNQSVQKLQQKIRSAETELQKASKKSTQLEFRAAHAEDALEMIQELMFIDDNDDFKQMINEILSRYRKENEVLNGTDKKIK
ncbi:chromosome-associated kinesin KIF4-like [Toxorhynchites rutilus septentrionalis]|uniref:chromosome-associated kinesin KIF4-like n=1 Tax=Toxorhynchites rutilus septentrionalis TaxID=329112 RepID=UPI00247ADBB3|nr:chromosome-associated kinesin KIF4-like [Toxorhynchites rutilus septentrionalis]